MPEEIKKEIFELSRLGKINLDQLAKIKAAKAIEKAAENPSGMAGAGVGMGMGYVMANQMGQLFNQQGNTGSPPPLPNSSFFIGVNGKQEGPFDLNALQQMITNGAWNGDTMVWSQGMAAWTKASEVEALKPLLGSVPPPLPSL